MKETTWEGQKMTKKKEKGEKKKIIEKKGRKIKREP